MLDDDSFQKTNKIRKRIGIFDKINVFDASYAIKCLWLNTTESVYCIFILFHAFVFQIRIPNDNIRKARWIEAIEKYQQFDHYRPRFNVCIRHFKESDFEQKKNKKMLKSDAIPSIFLCSEPDSSNNGSDGSDMYMVDLIDVADLAIKDNGHNGCESHTLLEVKIAELEKQILSMKIKHDIEKQKLERKIFMLEDSREQIGTKLMENRRELKQEKLQNIRMKDIIAELKNEKYISEDDEKFLNVSRI